MWFSCIVWFILQTIYVILLNFCHCNTLILLLLIVCHLFTDVCIYLMCAGGTSEIVHRPAAESYPQQRQPDISKAKKILLWQPTVNYFVLLSRQQRFDVYCLHFVGFIRHKSSIVVNKATWNLLKIVSYLLSLIFFIILLLLLLICCVKSWLSYSQVFSSTLSSRHFNRLISNVLTKFQLVQYQQTCGEQMKWYRIAAIDQY